MIKTTSSKLGNYLYNGDFDNFEKLINKWYVRYIIYPFNIDFLKLNKALLSSNDVEINQCFNGFNKVKMTDKQAEAVYQKAFYYYLQTDSKNKLKEYYELISKLEDKHLLNSIEDIYKVYVLKDNTLLEKYLEKYNNNNNDTNALFIIYNIYKNMNDSENYHKYLDIFNKLLEEGTYIKDAK